MKTSIQSLPLEQDILDITESYYELDDAPMSYEQVQKIQELADKQAFTGVTIRKISLLPNADI